ncbi:MAG TPA: pseudaminic acid cytidylyltransferase [Woeseiaceae bacterium]|nr:pseudaminic acid cytidylyltransferase [Woeseiaceae bacterium]
MTNLAIIPARGGSKRIPRKNIRPFHGQPVIAHVIRTALECGAFAEVMVSTEDEEIAGIAKKHGARVPFMRSATTAGDLATTVDVLREVIADYRKAGREFDTLCCIYPTAALTRTATLLSGQKLLQATADAACVLGVVPFEHPVQRALLIRNGKLQMLQPEHAHTRTQDLEATYHDAGQWYWIRTAALREPNFRILGPTARPLVLDALEAQDIDTEQDWALAEAKFQLLRGGSSA